MASSRIIKEASRTFHLSCTFLRIFAASSPSFKLFPLSTRSNCKHILKKA
ncbi:hypothetical protein Hanom_Chr06g00578891 [Helianthus anomalus]|nr:hypothetical protein HanIR_Chr15g0785851 [Helianthus annuus]